MTLETPRCITVEWDWERIHAYKLGFVKFLIHVDPGQPEPKPGDRLCIREGFYVQPELWSESHDEQPIHYAADALHPDEVEDYVLKPANEMPDWAIRYKPEIEVARYADNGCWIVRVSMIEPNAKDEDLIRRLVPKMEEEGRAIIRARKLNEIQIGLRNGHPYTCPHRDDGKHHDNGNDVGCLVATADGWWICPDCSYREPIGKTMIPVVDLAKAEELVEELPLPSILIERETLEILLDAAEEGVSLNERHFFTKKHETWRRRMRAAIAAARTLLEETKYRGGM